MGRPRLATSDSFSFRPDPRHDAMVLDPTHRPPLERSDPKQPPDREPSDGPVPIRITGSASLKDHDILDTTAFDLPPVLSVGPERRAYS